MHEEILPNRSLRAPSSAAVNTRFVANFVAKVAITTSLAAALVLLLLQLPPLAQWLSAYTQTPGAAAPHELLPVLLVIGACLVCIVGLTTWFIVLYNSFRVAGPLYRFGRDLELMSGLPEFHGFRSEDSLQELSQQFRVSINVIRRHYDEIERLLVDARDALDAGAQERFVEQMGKIHALLGRVRTG